MRPLRARLSRYARSSLAAFGRSLPVRLGSFADEGRSVDSMAALMTQPAPSYWRAAAGGPVAPYEGLLRDLCAAMPGADLPYYLPHTAGYDMPPVEFLRTNHAIVERRHAAIMVRPGVLLAPSTVTMRATQGGLAQFPGVSGTSPHYRYDPRVKKQIKRIDATVAVFAHGWCGTFGHFLWDAMPAIVALAPFMDAHRIGLLLQSISPWQRAWLDLAGVPPDAVRVEDGPVVIRDCIAASTLSLQHLRTPGPFAREMLLRLAHAADVPKTGSPRYLYLSRADHIDNIRTLDQDAEIGRALEPLGFVTVFPQHMTPAEQIGLFAGARIVVGPYGSAFANLGFMRPGGTVIEMQPNGIHHTWIWRMSWAMKLNYAVIVGAIAPETPVEYSAVGWPLPGSRFRYRVDPRAVVRSAAAAIARLGN